MRIEPWVSKTSLRMVSMKSILSSLEVRLFFALQYIIASRIAEHSPNLSVLVIEQGANNKDVPHIVNPVFYLQNLLPTTKTALFYKGNKAPQLADREPIVPCGGTLGGGSSINFMMYTRAQRSDFDNWKTEGWTADDMWPHLKRVRQDSSPSHLGQR
jgi:alcohol oxidase